MGSEDGPRQLNPSPPALGLRAGIGNTANARVLFERALPEVPPEKAASLWDRFLRFEADHGTLAAQLTVQQRRREALGEVPADGARIPSLKYRTLGLWPTGSDAQRSHFEQLLGERPAAAAPAAAAGEAAAQSGSRGGAQNGEEEGDASNGQAYEGGEGPEVVPEPVGSDITHFPTELGLFLSALPPPSACPGPAPDVDGVIEVRGHTQHTPHHQLLNTLEREGSLRIRTHFESSTEGGTRV